MTKDSNKAWNRVDSDLSSYNTRQYETKYRSTDFIIKCLKEELHPHISYDVLDVGCGGGGNLSYIAKTFQNCLFHGIDINKYFVDMAISKHIELDIQNTKFDCLDFKNLSEQYDVVGSSQFLEVLDVDKAFSFVDKCFESSKTGVYFQALFTERDLDYEINIHDKKYYKVVPYNIYSIKTINEIANLHGFILKQKKKFIIDVDLPDTHEGRGTYTIKDDKGTRMMFSDVLNLPWYFLYYEKDSTNLKEI